jgi:hypothetical protein
MKEWIKEYFGDWLEAWKRASKLEKAAWLFWCGFTIGAAIMHAWAMGVVYG